MNSNSNLDVTDHQQQQQQQQTPTAVQEHPLQDVGDLSEMDFPLHNQQQQQQQKPGNWVKFDDEAISENGRNATVPLAAKGQAATTIPVETMPATIQQQQLPRPNTPTTTAAATMPNKLSPPPPSRPKKPQQQQQQQSVTVATIGAAATTTAPASILNRNSAAVAPVQRTSTNSDIAPAVLTTESTHVNLNTSASLPKSNYATNSSTHNTNATSMASTVSVPLASSTPVGGSTAGGAQSAIKSSITIPVESTPPMRTIELSTGRIREGFANGDVIVTLLPANTKWPWITPALFRPELVPEELMAQGLTLTVEEYVHAMETLVNDYRFTLYNICYKRILVVWIALAFSVLLTLLFSGLQGVALFSLGVGWLFLNAAAIFLCMWMKLRLARGLERCLARVNNQLIKHKILLILDDRGRISCHKVNLCFLYFDATQCVNFLNEFLEQTEQNGGSQIRAGWEAKLDLDINDIIIQGNNPLRLSRKQERGLQLYLRYGSRWGNEALRGLIDVTPTEPGRHCSQFLCACQYIKHHLQCKPRVLDNIGMGDAAWRLTVPYQTRNTLAVNTHKQNQTTQSQSART